MMFAFDEVRMGEGIGDEWADSAAQAGEAGSIEVAAFPTAFDRSARLIASGAEQVGTCTRVTQQTLQRLAFDLYLDPVRPAVAVVTLVGADEEAGLQLRIEAGLAMTAAASRDQLTPGPPIPAGHWVRMEISAEGGSIQWRSQSTAEPDSAPEAGSLGQVVLAPITRICLAAAGPAGGVVSYDNLEIHGIDRGG